MSDWSKLIVVTSRQHCNGDFLSRIRQLAARHKELEQRLEELSSKSHLTEPEHLEQATIKKRKLQLKDRMEDIVRRSAAQEKRTA